MSEGLSREMEEAGERSPEDRKQTGVTMAFLEMSYAEETSGSHRPTGDLACGSSPDLKKVAFNLVSWNLSLSDPSLVWCIGLTTELSPN